MLVLFGVFRFLPLLGAVGLSLTEFQLGGDWRFVGVTNYRDLAQDSDLPRPACAPRSLYVAICVPLTVAVALGTALAAQQVRWARGVFRTALLTPYVTSLVLAGVVWRWLYEPLGLLDDPSLVLLALAVVGVWKGFGYAMLILFAGIQNVPPDCLDAAKADGASTWQRFRLVLLPFLRPALFFVVVIETIGAFQVFDTVYVMTGGGPMRASYTMAYAVYDYGFKHLDLGHAAAAGIVLWAVVLLVSLTQRGVLDRSR